MKFGLKQNVIAKINSVFARYPQIDKVVIYGSRAKGNWREGSDIDLTMFGKNLDLTLQLKIEQELDELLLPYQIDLSIYDYIDNPALREHINRVGKIFYEKGN